MNSHHKAYAYDVARPVALAVSVQDLTAGRPRLIVRDYIDPNTLKTIHKSEYVREQPLIETLTDTLEGGSRNGSASTSTAGSRMPISGNALDILTHIEQTVKGYGPTDNLKKQLTGWAKACEKDGADTELAAAYQAARWCELIRALATHNHDLTGGCPTCHENHIKVADPAGGYIKQTALVWNVERATCRNCGAVWEGEDGMRNLATRIL